jgi:glucose-6-phosphate-specific signal transduction histidine kinase
VLAADLAQCLLYRDASHALCILAHRVGGADPRRGSGLIGLTDRVETLGGTIEITSNAGNGTAVIATIPTDGWDWSE